MCISVYTYQQRLEYARKLKRLHELYVIKDNIHLTYKYKNQNKAIHNAHSLQDKIINSIIDDAVYGNANAIKNIDSTIEKLMTSTLENERKRIHHQKDKYVNRAVELNSERYTKILTNRINTEAIKLERKIESELRSGVHNGLSESQTRNVLQEKYQDTAKARIRNIIRDSVHTNESNISFINALNEGYNYKIWMNGRSKGKTRAWHKAKLIAPVPIEDYFDIYGPYGHKESMYPGDLYSGAENVANCRCWLRYTNRRPEGLSKTSNTYNIPNTSYLSPQNKPTNNANKENILIKPLETFKTRISNTTEKVTSKIKNIGGKITSKINHQKTNTKNYNHKREQQKTRFKFDNLFSFNKKPTNNESTNNPIQNNQKTPSKSEKEIFSEVEVKYSKKSMSKFKGIVKSEYLDGVLKHFEYFKKKLNNPKVDRNIEHCTIRKSDGTIVEFYTTNEAVNVGIPKDIQEEGRKKHIHTAIHSHPKGTSPISSPEDISKYAECGVINGLSHNKLGTMIIYNGDIDANKQKFLEIEEKIQSIKNDMLKDFRKYENNNKPVDLNNPNDLRRLNNYVDKNARRYVSRYKQVLKQYKIKVRLIR